MGRVASNTNSDAGASARERAMSQTGVYASSDPRETIARILARPREDVVAQCKRHVVGQDRVLNEVVGLMYVCLQRMERKLAGVDDLDLPRACAFMLAGSTASGKSFIMKVVCRVMGLTLVSVDCSGITGAGWVGDSVAGELRRVHEAAQRNPGHPVVAFWDEADKLVRKTREGGRSFDAQGNFLKLLDGDTIELAPERQGQEAVRLDAGRVLNVFAGAFMGVEKIVRKRLLSSGIAMAGQGSAAGLLSTEELRARMSLEDLMSWGFMPEFVGRFGAVVSVPALSRDSLREVVKGSPTSLERRISTLLGPGKMFGITDAAADFIAVDAARSGLGARRIDQLANHYEAEATVRLNNDSQVNTATLDVSEGDEGRVQLVLRYEWKESVEPDEGDESHDGEIRVPSFEVPASVRRRSRFEPDHELARHIDEAVGTSVWTECMASPAGIELAAKKIARYQAWRHPNPQVVEAAELVIRAVAGYLPFDPETECTLGNVIAYLGFLDIGLKDGWTYLDTFFFGRVEVCGIRGLEERAMSDRSAATPASVTALACYRRFLAFPAEVRREAGKLARERAVAATRSSAEAAWLKSDLRDVAQSVGAGRMPVGADGFVHLL